MASLELRRKEPLIRGLGSGGPFPGKVVDMHCHAAGIGAGGSGCFLSAAMRRSFRYKAYLGAYGVSERELELQGDSHILRVLSRRLEQSKSVSRAVVLALDGVMDASGRLDLGKTEMYVPNDYLARELKPYPHLIYAASVNPKRRGALELIRREKARGAALIKWIPPIQRIDPADKSILPFYRVLAELRLPLLVHTGDESAFTWQENGLGDPCRLRGALDQGVTVVAAHAAAQGSTGGVPNMRRLFTMMGSYRNLYADISALSLIQHRVHLRRLLEHPEIGDRLLYGTDYPLISTVLATPWLFAFNLGFTRVLRLSGIENPWDRDVAIKLAMGVPREVFARAPSILGLEAAASSSEAPGSDRIARAG